MGKGEKMIDIVEQFRAHRAHRDERIAEGQAAYLRHQFEFIGLKTPERRALQKEFLREKKLDAKVDWPTVWALWYLPEREFQYLALDYLRKMKKYLQASDLEKIKKLALSKSWWDTVDSLDELVGFLLLQERSQGLQENTNEKNVVNSTIRDWATAENFWVRRIAIDCQLGFKEKTDEVLLAFVIGQNLAGSTFEKEFFINKAIGWALRDLSKTDPRWVAHFIDNNRAQMSNLSIREGSKYLKNSI